MPKYKVIIRKENKKRGVVKYIQVKNIEDAEDYVLDQLICQRYYVDFADYGKMGVEPKIEYIINESERVVGNFLLEMGVKEPISFYFDIELTESNARLDGGIISG